MNLDKKDVPWSYATSLLCRIGGIAKNVKKRRGRDFLFFFLSHNVNYVNFDNLKMKPCASGLKKKSIPFRKISPKTKVCALGLISCICLVNIPFPIDVFCVVSPALCLFGAMRFVIKLA